MEIKPVAAPAPKKETVQRSVQPRAPRIPMAALHNVTFQMTAPVAGPVTLMNLSATGMGLDRKAQPRWPQRGDMLQGELRLSGQAVRVGARVMHVSADSVGCRFEENAEALAQAVREYFKIELAALSLRAVNPSVLKATEEGQPLWYTGRNNCDLYVLHRDGHLVRFELTLFGNHLTWKKGSTLQVIEQPEGADSNDKLTYKATPLDLPGKAPATDMVDTATKLLEAVDGIPAGIRHSILEIFRGASG